MYMHAMLVKKIYTTVKMISTNCRIDQNVVLINEIDIGLI